MSDLVFAEANDLVTEGTEPLVTKGVCLLVEWRRVQPVAVDLGDHELRTPKAVDTGDEAVVVEDVDLKSRLGQATVDDEGEEVVLEVAFSVPARPLELLDELAEAAGARRTPAPQQRRHAATLQ